MHRMPEEEFVRPMTLSFYQGTEFLDILDRAPSVIATLKRAAWEVIRQIPDEVVQIRLPTKLD